MVNPIAWLKDWFKPIPRKVPPFKTGDVFDYAGIRMHCLTNDYDDGSSFWDDVVVAEYKDANGRLAQKVWYPLHFPGLIANSTHVLKPAHQRNRAGECILCSKELDVYDSKYISTRSDAIQCLEHRQPWDVSPDWYYWEDV